MLLAAFFTPQETSQAYLRLLSTVVLHHGIPVSIYQDRHSALRRNDDFWSLEEQLAGRQRPTQVGQALEDLAIQPIFALSPQAKGRVERAPNAPGSTSEGTPASRHLHPRGRQRLCAGVHGGLQQAIREGAVQ